MTLPEIKSRLPILTVLAYYGHQPDSSKRICCPFHEDKTPSMQVYPKTDTVYCFSPSCPTHGHSLDSIDFIMYQEQCSKHQAILKAQHLITLSPMDEAPIPASLVSATSLPEGESLSRIAVLSKFYASSRHRNETARHYLSLRGLTDIEVGYVSDRMGLTWNDKLRQSALQLGLLLEKPGGYLSPRFKGCAVFALRNREGQTVGIYGRSVSDTSDKAHYYLPGAHQGLYPHYPPADTTHLLLSESVIDAASLLQAGVPYPVVALYGTNGFTPQHQSLIGDLAGLQEVILFFDGDQGGRKAVATLADKLHTLRPGLRVSTVATPDGEDCNSLLQSHEKELFTHLLDTRQLLDTSQLPPLPDAADGSLPEGSPQEPSLPSVEPTQQPLADSVPVTSLPVAPILNVSHPELLTYQDHDLHMTILGGIKLHGLDKLRVTLKIETPLRKQPPLRHNLDLYQADAVNKLLTLLSEQLGVASQQAQASLLDLTEKLESHRLKELDKLQRKPEKTFVPQVQGQQQAVAYLSGPDLMQRTLQQLGQSGIVGEENNRAVMFFVFLSRLLDNPLHVVSMGASGTGKTYLQERVAALLPPEYKLEVTTLSENALYYFGQHELARKVLLIEDLDGAQEVLYPLRELKSKQKITKTVTLKDSKGNLKTVSFTVEGPVCIAGCTTRDRLYEDNENRSLLLYLDDSAQQDEQIMAYQRRKAAGKVDARTEAQLQELFQYVHRVLEPLRVVNPYAERLVLPDSVFKKRRSNQLYLQFIQVITLYHQYQRQKKMDPLGSRYIETTLEDIEWANKLLKDVLLRKSDELSGACRRFLESLKAHLQKTNQHSFYAREVRKDLRLNASNLKRYLWELSRNGYVKISGGSKAKGYAYEITSYQEYEQLRQGIGSVLDEPLGQLQAEALSQQLPDKEKGKLNTKKRSGSVVH